MIQPTITTKRILGRAVLPVLAIATLLAGTASSEAAITRAFRDSVKTASMEGLSKIGLAYARQIGNDERTYSFAQARPLAALLAKELLSRTGLENKGDELGEIAAGIAAGISTTAKFNTPGTLAGNNRARATLFGILKSTLNFARNTTSGLATADVFRDVAGSLALSINNNLQYGDAVAKDRIRQFLLGKVGAIAGRNQTLQDAVRAGIEEGFGKIAGVDPNSKYEDGNIPTLINDEDPITDQRNG